MSKAPSSAKRAKRKPIRKNASRKPAVSVSSSSRAFRDEEDRWEVFQERLRVGVLARKTSQKALSQYEKPRSYLKREVYRHVLERHEDGRAKELQKCIERAREGYVPTIPTFAQNPFHWALLGLQHINALELESPDVSRFGRQLAYASRHNVPPQLLIGFISQTGSPNLISLKYDSGDNEEWHGTLPKSPVARP